MPLSVQVQRADQPTTGLDLQADLQRVHQLAQLLDAQFEIAGVKVGWDAIIGLIPVIGDAISAAIGMYPIHVARKHNLGKWLQARMIANLAVDWVIGSIPVVGDAFDVGFKANLKNARLLEKAAARQAAASATIIDPPREFTAASSS